MSAHSVCCGSIVCYDDMHWTAAVSMQVDGDTIIDYYDCIERVYTCDGHSYI